MKKLKNIFGALLLASSLFFAGCYNAVFYEIHQDVESEDATVSGTINQITRYTLQDSNKTEYLVCNADGGLRYKLASNRSHGSWSTYDYLPFSLHSYDYYATSHNGEQIIQVLADKTHLYLLTCVYFDDNDEGTVAPKYVKLWTAEISDWNSDPSWKCINTSTSETAGQIFKVYKNSSSGYYYSAFCIFSTNSINPANRKVYVRSGKYGAYYATKSKISTSEIQKPVYYEVDPDAENGVKELTTMPTTWSGGSVTTSYTSINVCSAAYFNNQTNFFTGAAAVTNEKYTDMTYTDLASNLTYTEPDCVYWGSGSTLYYNNDFTATSAKGSISASHNISALAVCADSILIGMGNTSAYSSSTSGGITHSYLSSGVPTGTTDFSTNAASQISSGYIVFSLLNANPAEDETASALYASIGFCGTGSSTAVSYSSVGLWSYYPSRGNWNRE
ncbi:hypothetical protein MSI_04000 [Treponema sp. JC4]|uniref:hypothetical protein n=1 Tax=Treponema sp. JC4 TaxID=1124982 RepID=UPI00025B0D73|nr:hypothetical protein [Treponema sp. JC4]EID85969.1 hypothetical protein MSI_04000 [Treponema sp. JC4]